MKLITYFLFFLLSMATLPIHAQSDGEAPPSHIHTFDIMEKTTSHFWDYAHFKVIGVCFWVNCDPACISKQTPELDEYQPDLIVASYNGYGNNPWAEANDLLDSPAHTAATSAAKNLTGYPLTNGTTDAESNTHDDSIHTKSVDIVGNLNPYFDLPIPHLALDTQMGVPYFQSDVDALGDRTGLAESIRPETLNPFSNFIGQNFTNHWGYEFPRSMSIHVANDYKASLMAGLHAADIVTNQNTLHVVKPTQDSCGHNCAVANVIEETIEAHEIWQEVYPLDRHVIIGEDDSLNPASLGSQDEQAGNGNYVFVLWRHYRGCMQTKGDLLWVTVSVPPTQKR